MAKKAMKVKQQRNQKFSLQNLWPPTCLFKKIRNLQNLLP